MLFDKSKVLMTFSLFFLVFTLASVQEVKAQAPSDIFTSRECLDSSFDISVSHPGWPMGLTKRNLGVEKKKCLITITHQKLKVWKRKWMVDVCREPVHIKSGTGAVEVHKRKAPCTPDVNGGQDTYCQELQSIKDVLQDDGLIFAKGEKEDIETPHGQIYCTYLLVQKYLSEGRVLSRHDFQAQLYPDKQELEEEEVKKVLETPESSSVTGKEPGEKEEKTEEIEISPQPRMEPALDGGPDLPKKSQKTPEPDDESEKENDSSPSQSSGGSGSF